MNERLKCHIEDYYGNIPDNTDKIDSAEHFYNLALEDVMEVIKKTYGNKNHRTDAPGHLATLTLREVIIFIDNLTK